MNNSPGCWETIDMRRVLLGLAIVLLVGCTTAAEEREERASSGPDAPPPSDLRTRNTGSDWPSFLGPTGDSVSSEKGIVTPWPKHGPRIVWHKGLGIGYGMPAISLGRLFVFDRVKDRA